MVIQGLRIRLPMTEVRSLLRKDSTSNVPLGPCAGTTELPLPKPGGAQHQRPSAAKTKNYQKEMRNDLKKK